MKLSFKFLLIFRCLFAAGLVLGGSGGLCRAEDQENETRVVRSQAADYVVTAAPTGRSLLKNGMRNYAEWGYKLYSESEEKKEFSKDGWSAVSILDREGFKVASDLVHRDNLLAGQEYYGFVWIKVADELKVSSAKAEPISGDKLVQAKSDKIYWRRELAVLFKENGLLDAEARIAPMVGSIEVRESYRGDAEDAAKLELEKQSLRKFDTEEDSPEPEEVPEPEEKTPQADVYKDSSKRITNEDLKKALGELNTEMEVQEQEENNS